MRGKRVRINNLSEYMILAKIADQQGFRWNSGHLLTEHICEKIPIVLVFCHNKTVCYNSFHITKYDYTYANFTTGSLRHLIDRRKNYVDREDTF